MTEQLYSKFCGKFYPVRTPYKDTTDAEDARYYRSVIRKIKKTDLTKTQREVLMLLFNLHWKHKNDTGTISMSRDKLAKRADCSPRTIIACLKMFRESGILAVRRYGKGGRKPTVYTFSTDAMCKAYAPTRAPETTPGELVKISTNHNVSRNSDPVKTEQILHPNIYKHTNGVFGSEPDSESWWKSVLQNPLEPLQDPDQGKVWFDHPAFLPEVCHA